MALGVGAELGVLALMLHMTYPHDSQIAAVPVRRQRLAALQERSVRESQGRRDPDTAGDRRRVPDGDAGDHRNAAVQPVPERVSDRAGGLRGRALHSAVVLFVLFRARIFAGALLVTSGSLVLGENPAGPPAGGIHPWREYAMLVPGVALVIVGFWLPAPLLQLIRSAAGVVTGGRHDNRGRCCSTTRARLRWRIASQGARSGQIYLESKDGGYLGGGGRALRDASARGIVTVFCRRPRGTGRRVSTITTCSSGAATPEF